MFPDARENGKFTYETYKKKIEAEILKELRGTGLTSMATKKIDLDSKDVRLYRQR